MQRKLIKSEGPTSKAGDLCRVLKKIIKVFHRSCEYAFLLYVKAVDKEYYLADNPDAKDYFFGVCMHYLIYGVNSLASPNKHFDQKKYLKEYPDVMRSSMTPYYHYLKYGIKENRLSFATMNQRQISESAHLIRIKEYLQTEAKKDYVFYTAITGSYENFKLPEYFDELCDYYVFTDNEELKVPLPFTKIILPKSHLCSTRLSRWVKLRPHMLFKKKYKYAVWADASFLLKGSFMGYISKMQTGNYDVGFFPHLERFSFLEEVEACIEAGKDDAQMLNQQKDAYMQLDFFEAINNQKLIEAGVFIVDLQKSSSGRLFDIWYEQFEKFSKRDQLSLPYALTRAEVNIKYLEESLELVPKMNKLMFEIYSHNMDNAYESIDSNLLSSGQSFEDFEARIEFSESMSE